MYTNEILDEYFKQDHERKYQEDKIFHVLRNLTSDQVTDTVTGGAAGSTVKLHSFIMPTKGELEKATGILMKVQTGEGNVPTLQLYNETQGEVIAEKEDIALAGTIGDTLEMTLNADNVIADAGDVISIRYVTPAAVTVSSSTVADRQKCSLHGKPLFN